MSVANTAVANPARASVRSGENGAARQDRCHPVAISRVTALKNHLNRVKTRSSIGNVDVHAVSAEVTTTSEPGSTFAAAAQSP